MKIRLYRSNNIFLEEPIVISTCSEFKDNTNKSLCNNSSPSLVSKNLYTIKFGKYYFKCIDSCLDTVSTRKTPYNKELNCNCACQ